MAKPLDPPPTDEAVLRSQLIDAAVRLSARGLLQADNGNLSGRLANGCIVITPAGRRKDRLAPEELIRLDPSGPALPSTARPSSELPMHLEAYRQRPDITAVIHAHPPCATALTLAGIPYPSDILFEGLAALGEVITAPLAMPGGPEGAQAISDLVLHHDAILLPHHGVLVVASDLDRALLTIERLEHVAQVFAWAERLGGARRLPPEITRTLRDGHLPPPAGHGR
jgi:L-fuculose-phosphate aldolase